MTLDEAIEHCEEVVVKKTEQAWEAQLQEEYSTCKECAAEHRQLAEWLKELRAYRKMYREEHEDDCLRAESEDKE